MQAITIGKFFKRKLRKRKGFSLIETSVLVSVAAAAAVGFLSWTQPAAITNSAKAVETRVKMDAIAKALENFRVEKGRLPCPADPYMRVDNTRSSTGGTDYYPNDFGQEDLDAIDTIVNGVTNYGVDCPVSTGTIPVYAIGLGQEYMNDAWGRRFTYQISKTICAADAGTEGGVSTANSRLFGCTKNDYNKGTGDIIIKDTAAVTKADKAIAVIVSHGPNGKGAFIPSGIKLTNDGSATEIENGNSDNTGSATDKTFIMGMASATFDDIVYFKTKVQMERLTDRANTKQISVADCQTNSEAIRAITATESTVMATQVTGFERGSNNTGEQVALSLLKTIQSMCVTYYGATTGITTGWSGAQCPGTANVTAGSTYYAPTDTCTCASGLWDGNCVADWSMIVKTTPTSGRKLWFDAADSTTLFTDAGCTAAAVATNTIACWKDKMNTLNVTSPTGPVYTNNSINGRPALVFNGTNQYLITNSSPALFPTAVTLFVSVNNNSDTDYVIVETSNNDGWWCSGNGGGRIGHFGAFRNVRTNNNPLGTMPISGQSIFTVRSTASQYEVFINGVSQGVYSGDYSAGSYLQVGKGYPYSGWARLFNGSIGELILYNTDLSSQEIASVNNYLGAKWGVPIAP